MIRITCDGCGSTLSAPEAYAGRTARCKKCGQSLVISLSSPASKQATAPEPTDLAVAFPAEVDAVVRETLVPGEVLRAYCDMRSIVEKKDTGFVAAGNMEFVAAVAAISLLASAASEQRPVTVGLTSKNLVFLLKKTNFWGKRVLTGDSKKIPLDLLSGVVTQQSQKRNLWYLTFKDAALNLTLGGLKNAEEHATAFMREVELALSVKSPSLADEFEKLFQLAHDGVLSSEEFKKAKEAYLGKTPDVRDLAVSNLRQLHSLYKSGVLTEGEFRLKKWDILSR